MTEGCALAIAREQEHQARNPWHEARGTRHLQHGGIILPRWTPPIFPRFQRPQRTQPAFDLFLIFAAANIVATTLQTGAVLGARYGRTDVVVLVVAGACFGASLVAMLAPVGSTTGVPSMIAARAPLGYRGAQVVSGLLYLTNFAWIAVNNTIAASVCAQVLGGSDTARLWSAGLGVLGHRGRGAWPARGRAMRIGSPCRS